MPDHEIDEASLFRPFIQHRNALMAQLAPPCGEVFQAADPHWRQGVIRITRPPHREKEVDHLIRVVLSGSFEGAPPFDARPAFAYVNGPKGDTEVPVAGFLEQPAVRLLLIMLVQVTHLLPNLDPWSFLVQNPEHKLVPVPGATRLKFRDGTHGFVLGSDPDNFVVAKGPSFEEATSLERYSRERVRVEQALRVEAQKDDTVSGYIYLPRRFDKQGLVIEEPVPAVNVHEGRRINHLMARLGNRPRLDL